MRRDAAADIADVIRRAETPPGTTHWSLRSMSGAVDCGPHYRIWRAFRLKPHRNEIFKLSKDPLFVEKVRDGLYLDPPGAGAERRREK